MVNQAFQELKRQWANSLDREPIIEKMRENLMGRNSGNNLYTFEYTKSGETVDINICNVHELFEIDGDMCPQMK